MKIIFCNGAYLRYYDGRVAGELKPKTGGKWVLENDDAHEKWNFLNVDGVCYGYVQVGGEQMHIERIDRSFKNMEVGEDVTVIWCAVHPEKGETVIVGWYEHANAYRFLNQCKTTPITGLDRFYWFSTEAENAYLLPEEERSFIIGRASKDGMGKGFGQSNCWYADSENARESIIPEVLKYIESHRGKRVNVLTEQFEPAEDLKIVTDEELEEIGDVDDLSDMEYLPLGYRLFNMNPTDPDGAFLVGMALCNLHQYSKAVEWFEKTIELDPGDWDTKGRLAYVYSQCERYDDTIRLAEELLKVPNASEPDFRDEVYCMLADAYYFSKDIDAAVSWQDKILDESSNKELIEHTKQVKETWLKNN